MFSLKRKMIIGVISNNLLNSACIFGHIFLVLQILLSQTSFAINLAVRLV